jgi:membrane dipeptidase
MASRAFGFHQRQFDTFDWLDKALTADDIRRAKAEGRRAGWLNAQLVGGVTLELLDSFYMLGLRMLMLTYNNMNHIGAGCTERTNAGVSNFGARLIKRMNELGVIVDISHCGKQTTLDACALSSVPVIASHTCCEGVYGHARAKSDEELRRIKESGGLVGIVAVPFFLAPGAEVTVDAMLDHIDYASQLIGWEHVGIGTDWPMMWPKAIVARFFSPANLAASGFRPEHNIQPEVNLVGYDDHRDLPNITRGLVKRGYSDEQIKGILGENFLRVFDAVQSSQAAAVNEKLGATA